MRRGAVGDPPAWRSKLWRRYALVMMGLFVVLITGFGGAELAASYNGARSQALKLQEAEANEAATALQAALLTIRRHVGAVNALPWRDGWLGLTTRREEFARLLRLVPAVEALSYRDAQGRELLHVSRRTLDRIATPAALAAAPASSAASSAAAGAAAAGAAPAAPAALRIRYSEGLEPMLDLALPDPLPADAAPGAVPDGTTTAHIDLRTLARELCPALTLADAEVYAVDADGTLALHRDPMKMLSRQRAPFAPSAPLAAGAEATAAAPPEVSSGPGLAGAEVLRSAVAVPELGWAMAVERPRALVMAPVWATVARVAAFLTLGALLALGAALALAGRLSRPVRQLHAAVGELAAGHLDTAIELRSGDELDDLAAQFNRMAANLRASMGELEHRVAARTAELQRANRHKSEFLANMSHELRTPLNAILGFADVLREGMAGPLSDEQREYLGDIHASGVHLLALINDVLDLSRIEAGQLELERSDFDVVDTIQSAAALLRQRCRHKGLTLAIEIDPALGLWHADPRRFKQVLLNLLGNAVKFTPAGGHVTLRAGVDPAEGLWVEVADDGIGIAPEDHAAVFEEFRQVGSDSAGRAEGTGLGLALVRRLVRQHGGEVTLASALGRGARFRFNIPAQGPGRPE